MVVNLGHCYRKQQRWDDAVQVYERALGLCPGQAGTYAALGFTRHLKVTSHVVWSVLLITGLPAVTCIWFRSSGVHLHHHR